MNWDRHTFLSITADVGTPPARMRTVPLRADRTWDGAEIRAAAETFIERLGPDAPRQAGIRAEELTQAGDAKGREC